MVYESLCAGVTRRDILRISLAASAMFAIGACRSSSSHKEIDKANKELRKTLDRIAQNDVVRTELASIARGIEARAREMVTAHREFLTDFDSLTVKADVTAEQLQRKADRFQTRRLELRNSLLRLQGELRAELNAEEWAEVVDALNKKASAIVESKTPSNS